MWMTGSRRIFIRGDYLNRAATVTERTDPSEVGQVIHLP